jgi:hypothetical protein
MVISQTEIITYKAGGHEHGEKTDSIPRFQIGRGAL